MMKSATQIFSCKMPVFILFLLHEFFLVNPFLVIYKFNQLLFRSEFQVFLKTAKNENIHHPIVQARYYLHMLFEKNVKHCMHFLNDNRPELGHGFKIFNPDPCQQHEKGNPDPYKMTVIGTYSIVGDKLEIFWYSGWIVWLPVPSQLPPRSQAYPNQTHNYSSLFLL